MNPTLLGLLLAAAPIGYDLLKSSTSRKRKTKRKRAKSARRRNR